MSVWQRINSFVCIFIIDYPLSLLSQSRLAIRRSLNNKLHEIQNLGINNKVSQVNFFGVFFNQIFLDIGENLLDILLFKCFSPSDFDLDKMNEVYVYCLYVSNYLNVLLYIIYSFSHKFFNLKKKKNIKKYSPQVELKATKDKFYF